MSSSLNARRRERELDELSANPVIDVLVIGGGVTGAGVALDAAARGLSVVLAEKHDLAFGTSRWSSKLVHGGLRYLASGAVGIARESAIERGILIERTAPHLVRPFPQIVPLLPGISGSQARLIRTGFALGDALRASAGTSHHTLPRSRRITRAETVRLSPAVRVAGLRGGLLAWDGQLQDDARLVVAVARTAAGRGASILTRCRAVEATGQGALLRDELTGSEFQVRARTVINATGVWAANLAPGIELRPSRGTHLVVSAQRLGGMSAGLTVPVPGSRSRYVFALPSPEGRVYIGLTDEDARGAIPDVPRATDHEISFLLETFNTVLSEPLTSADILATYSGLRPLLDTGDAKTADISRKHAVITASDGLVTIVGGKLTTYRRMAQDAVDAALARAGIAAAPCRTAGIPLTGAASRARLAAVAAPARLVARYGTEATTVQDDGGAEDLVPGGLGVTAAELRFAVRHELALDESDLLDRRTRIGLVPGDRERALPAARAALRLE